MVIDPPECALVALSSSRYLKWSVEVNRIVQSKIGNAGKGKQLFSTAFFRSIYVSTRFGHMDEACNEIRLEFLCWINTI